MKAKDLINQIYAANTPQDIRAVNKAMSEFLSSSPDQQEVDAVRLAFHEATAVVLERIEQEQEETLRFVALNGTKYNLEDWLTPAEYARQFHLSTPNMITNWIARGVIPKEDILEIKELNGIRLIRNKVYKSSHSPIAK